MPFAPFRLGGPGSVTYSQALGINFFTGEGRMIPRQERYKNDFARISQQADVARILQFS